MIGLITLMIFGAYLYSIYKKVENFEVQNINELSFLDINNEGNSKLLSNGYVGLMSDAYNKQVIDDEMAINKLYNNAIIRANMIAKLTNESRNNQRSKSAKFPIGKSIKTIKSKNNAQLLSVKESDATGNYNILVNDKCLTVSGLCDTNNVYCVQNCQNNLYTSDSQKFIPVSVETSADVKKIMGNSANISNKLVYPFNVFRSVVDGTCLAMSNNGLTLEDCNLNDLRHQWEISPDENICLTG